MDIPGIGSRIHGRYYDYSSIELAVGPIGVCVNISDIDYSQKLDPGIFRGTSPMIRGRTTGVYDAEGSFTIYVEDYEVLRTELYKGGGYMTTPFDITVNYRELGANVPITDCLRGCRITNEGHNLSQGNNAVVVKVSLSILEIVSSGKHAVRTYDLLGIDHQAA